MVLEWPGWRPDCSDGGQTCSREELENNSRKPRDLIKNRHCDSLKKGQLTLSQGMVKKGEDVAVGDDDDAVRTSVTKPSYSDTVY
jgi:hypothetical protein